MHEKLTKITVATVGLMAASVSSMPQESYAISNIPQTVNEVVIEEPKEEAPKEKRYVCNTCNAYEKRALKFFQDRGIRDKNALSTIMGNIRQESTFIPNICEGGSRRSYPNCNGGYGLIQFTNAPRFYGLGEFARKFGGNPSTLDTQLRYMFHEQDWKMIEHQMKVPGKTINDYMRLARKWIRWGHHGARTDYAYQYANKLTPVQVPL